MQTHYALRSLSRPVKPDRDVDVLFSIAPDGRALLFIHGFSGDAVKTWSEFDALLQTCPAFAARDIFFYGYDGLRAEMNASASIFRDFLDRMLVRGAALVSDSLPAGVERPYDFAYRECVIVAHSLGAVIARRALLDATRMNAMWLSRIKLVLYAPAHKGASIAKLAVEASTSFPFLSLFGAGARFKSPLIDQLDSKFSRSDTPS
jgi:pimeloyl-ACP methyl ester carboxylesterase